MSEPITALLRDHDFRLLAASVVVALGSGIIAFRIYGRMQGAKGLVRGAWALLAALVAGAGVWAAHVLAMRGYLPTHGLGLSPEGAIASLLLVVATMGTGLFLAPLQEGRSSRIAGGLIIAIGLCGMQTLDLLELVEGGRGTLEQATIAVAVAVCAALTSAALICAGHARGFNRNLVGASLLTLASLSTNVVSTMAVTLVQDWAPVTVGQTFSGGTLTLVVVAMAVLIILGGLGAVIIETQTSVSALERIRRLADAAYEGIVVVREGRINDANAAFCTLAGGDLEALAGMEIADLLIFPGDVAVELSGGVDETRLEGFLRPTDGAGEIPVEIFCRPMGGEARAEVSGLTVLAIRDLRERRAAMEQIRYLAEHDGLTGLPNRHAMQVRLAAALERAEAADEGLALVCIDLDHFKEVNDLHGHLAGDALLVEVGRRLRDQITAPSFAARLGGDEFVIVQVAAGEQPAAAAELASQILESLRGSVTFEGQDLALAASLGISLYPDDGRTAEALLANADMALYRTKENGRGAYSFFKREMDENIRERRNLARELRQAISDETLEVYYQPLAKAGSGEVCGFEALCRWPHPTRGMVSPADFIPVAEESGLIIPLGEWVLRQACADAARWEKPLRIAVNLSPLQLNQPALPTLVHEILIETGLSPQRLELEVTESALFKDYQRALDNLRRLKALGVRIAMDDFGTGFSSLSTLQSFPFDKLKIDKSFVEQIHAHDRAMVIVKAVLGLGRSLGIPVVAEGVETQEQISFLRGEDCAELQGYAIGRPARIETMTRWTEGAPEETPSPVAKPRKRSRAA